jgi:hypothetical protein
LRGLVLGLCGALGTGSEALFAHRSGPGCVFEILHEFSIEISGDGVSDGMF